MLKTTVSLIVSMLMISVLQAQPVSEFRGAWVSTVVNIDWPSQGGLSSDQQREEYIRMLDVLQQNGINAVIVQIRPSADAFYISPYEPWSEWLTGKQGKAPEPFYDPLVFMIEEAHKRKMEFHAWFNPYRAVMNTTRSSIASNHITRRKPHWFVTYGTQKLFNPGLPEVWDYINIIVKDVVQRYNVDAIHFDDYFYPYPIPGRAFPDESTYRKYGQGMDKEDWRRSNVDSVILKISNTIKSIKPKVKFGISPFGVWRNVADDEEGSNTKAGLTNYDDLYADILLWLENGWIDYAAPQLYWEIGHNKADFEVLADWWSKHSYGKHIYIGHGFYRAIEHGHAGWKRTSELPNQISLLRKYPEIKGSIFFTANVFYKNPLGWCDSLQKNYYNTTASIPAMPWLSGEVYVQKTVVTPTAPIVNNTSSEKKSPSPVDVVKPIVIQSIKPTTSPSVVKTENPSEAASTVVKEGKPAVELKSAEATATPAAINKTEKMEPVLTVIKEDKAAAEIKPAVVVEQANAQSGILLIDKVQQLGANFYTISIKKVTQQNPSITAVKLYISYDESLDFEKSRQYSMKENCESCVFEVRFAPVKNKCRLFFTYVYSDGAESEPLEADTAKGVYFEKTDAVKNNWIVQ